jgi:hypothetical protein
MNTISASTVMSRPHHRGIVAGIRRPLLLAGSLSGWV